MQARKCVRAIATLSAVLALGAFAGPAFGEGGTTGKPDPPFNASSMDRYLSVFEKLIELGLRADAEALERNPEAFFGRYESALTSQGFDQQSFTRFHMRVMQAYAASQMSGPEQQSLRAAMQPDPKQLEQFKAHLPPEQFAAMMKGLEEAKQATREFESSVPAGDRALVERYTPRLEALFERASNRPQRRERP